MSYKWPEKDPDETADFSVDWSRFLGSDSIVSAVFFVDDENGTKTQVSTAQIVNNLQFIEHNVEEIIEQDSIVIKFNIFVIVYRYFMSFTFN